MAKIDLKKELKELYGPSTKKVLIVDVPKMNFLMVNGAGDPNNSWSKLSLGSQRSSNRSTRGF